MVKKCKNCKKNFFFIFLKGKGGLKPCEGEKGAGERGNPVCLVVITYPSPHQPALMLFRVHLSVRCGILPCLSFSLPSLLSAISFVLLYPSFNRPSLFFCFPLFPQLYFFLYFPFNYILSGTYFSLSLPSRKSVWMSLVEIKKSPRLQKYSSKREINRRMACPLMVRNLVSQSMGEKPLMSHCGNGILSAAAQLGYHVCTLVVAAQGAG